MKKTLLIFAALFFLASAANAQWNTSSSYPGVTSDGSGGLNVTGSLAIPTIDTGVSTYTPGAAAASVTIDLSSKSWHIVNLPAVTGVSLVFTGATSASGNVRTYRLVLNQAGASAGTVVWTGATEHDSGTSPTLTTQLGAHDTFALVYGLQSGTTLYVYPAGSAMR